LIDISVIVFCTDIGGRLWMDVFLDYQSIENHMSKISKYEENELTTAFNQTFNRIKSCSVHLRENIDKFENTLENDLKKIMNKYYNEQGVVRTAINNTMSEKSKVIDEKIDKFLADTDSMLENHFSHIQQNYVKLLENFRDNQYLLYTIKRLIKSCGQFILFIFANF
jgi:gas vesicle protein